MHNTLLKRFAAAGIAVLTLCTAAVCVYAEDEDAAEPTLLLADAANPTEEALGDLVFGSEFVPSAESKDDILVVSGSASVTMYQDKDTAADEIKESLESAMAELTEHTEDVMNLVKAEWEAKTDGAPLDHATVVKVFDISGEPGEITLKFGFANAEDVVLLLHRINGVWHSEEFTVNEDGSITINPESLSPFAVIADNREEPERGNEDSPKTGDQVKKDLAYAGAFAAAGAVLLGVYFVIKKSSKHKNA